MFTYVNNPPCDGESETAADIQKRGEISLSKSLSIQRIIAFTGSGTTVEYGRPSWHELINIIINLTYELTKLPPENNKESLSKESLKKEFKSILSNNLEPKFTDLPKNARYDKDFIYTFLDLCESIFKGLEEKYPCPRQIISKKLADPLDNSKPFEYKTKEIPNSSDIKRINGGTLIIEKTKKILEKLKKEDLIIYKNKLKLTEANHLDPLKNIFENLGIRQFLTLNFDIEIERLLGVHYANKNDKSHKEFINFIENPNETPKNSDYLNFKRIDLKNGMQQSIRTSTINGKNLGELYSFGVFSRNFQSNVFHLHGRIDDPENMILTLKDYQRLYLKTGEQRKTFEEARYAIFSGSDIIFIGLGLSESDIMIPIREFSIQNSDISISRGTMYALIFSSTEENHEAENISTILKFYKNYGIYTIIIDDASTIRARKELLKSIIEINQTEFKENDSIKSWADKVYKKIQNATQETTNKSPELNFLLEVIKLARSCEETDSDLTKKLISIEFSKLAELLNQRLMTRALCDKIQDISEKRDQWWQEWQELPDYRIAIYHKNIEGSQSSDEPIVWVRQRAYYDHVASKDKIETYITETLKDAIKENELQSEPSTGIRVLRLTADSGYGKGGLANLLSYHYPKKTKESRKEYVFESVLSHINYNNKNINVKYIGGFFAHLTFTLEFTSIIFGLIRFLLCIIENQINKSQKPNTEYKNFINDIERKIIINSPDREFGLSMLKSVIYQTNFLFGNDLKTRIFVCISGIDRLVNDKGDVYSPVYREFFRILTGYKPGYDKKIPFDIVLISKKTITPIRYLSKEIRIPFSKKNADKVYNEIHKKNPIDFYKRKESNIWIKKWHTLEKIERTTLLDEIWLTTSYRVKQMIIRTNEKDNFSPTEFDKLTDSVNKKSLDFFSFKKIITIDDFDYLFQFLQKNILYIYLTFSLTNLMIFSTFNQTNSEYKDKIRKFLFKVQIAAGRGGSKSFIRAILQEFRNEFLKRIINDRLYDNRVAGGL
ncbi:MAG: SIR2 family protein [Thiolinea sp.]